jgi:hypothetical protein
MKWYFLQDSSGYLNTSPLSQEEANKMADENWSLRFEDFNGSKNKAIKAAEKFNCDVKMKSVGGNCQCGQH